MFLSLRFELVLLYNKKSFNHILFKFYTIVKSKINLPIPCPPPCNNSRLPKTYHAATVESLFQTDFISAKQTCMVNWRMQTMKLFKKCKIVLNLSRLALFLFKWLIPLTCVSRNDQNRRASGNICTYYLVNQYT